MFMAAQQALAELWQPHSILQLLPDHLEALRVAMLRPQNPVLL